MTKDVSTKPLPTDQLPWEYVRPKQLSKMQTLSLFIWNPETKTFCGRTASSWGKIGLFYLIFYGCLAALVAICFWGFFQTLDPRTPKWQLEQSIIGTNPGMGFRPLPPKENVESTLIWYKARENKYEYWVNVTNEFLEEYRKPGTTPGGGENVANCDYDRLPAPGKVCTVDIKKWAPCTVENMYGYKQSAPCIFLKLNKIFGWVPEYYNDTTDLPQRMPDKLKKYIIDIKNPKERNTIWVSCEGENPADQEHIGPVEYHPKMGFPGYYYPYENSKGYLSPLVAVEFKRPAQGVLINIECKAWAKNIHHNRYERLGLVHFELFID